MAEKLNLGAYIDRFIDPTPLERASTSEGKLMKGAILLSPILVALISSSAATAQPTVVCGGLNVALEKSSENPALLQGQLGPISSGWGVLTVTINSSTNQVAVTFVGGRKHPNVHSSATFQTEDPINKFKLSVGGALCEFVFD